MNPETKTLYLVRHAKSSWKDKSLRDVKRPLNKRGKRDAPFMAELFARTSQSVDLILSSHAVRALETARTFAKALSYSEKDIQINKSIYDAECFQLLDVLKNVDDEYRNVLCVGHNPSITQLSNYLTTDEITNVPTSGIVQLELHTPVWSSLEDCKVTLMAFQYPKKYIPAD